MTINEILDLPFAYMIQLLNEKEEAKREESFSDALDTLGI